MCICKLFNNDLKVPANNNVDLICPFKSTYQTGPLDFEDTRNQGNRRRGGASAPPQTRLGVPPSKFCSARYRHFENLVSRKIQSLRNPESIKYSVLFVVRLSLSTIPCLPVCLNAKYQSTPPPPHPLLFPTNPRLCH